MSVAAAIGGSAGRARPPVLVLGLVAAAVIAPFVASGYQVLQLTQIVVYAIALLGLNLLTGFTGQISLGHGAFYGLGAYAAMILQLHAGIPGWATPPLAGVVCFAIGYAFGRPAARLAGLYLALATFALAVTLPQLLMLDGVAAWTGGSAGQVFARPRSPIPGVLDDDQSLYLVSLAIACALFAAAANVIRSRTGRALIAVRDQPIAAETMGIDTASSKALMFGVSALVTGTAGALGALATGFVAPDSFPILLSIQLLVGSVVGGVASIGGALIGAVFIELVPELASRLSDSAPGALYGVILIGCMLAMPGGAAGAVDAVRARRAARAAARSGDHTSPQEAMR